MSDRHEGMTWASWVLVLLAVIVPINVWFINKAVTDIKRRLDALEQKEKQ